MSNSSGGKAWKYIQVEREKDFSTAWAILLWNWQKSEQVIAQADAERFDIWIREDISGSLFQDSGTFTTLQPAIASFS